MIIQVLSKSTAAYDRSDKFHLYRKISTFREYVLIEQEKQVVDVYYKPAESDLWQIKRYEGLNEEIALQSLGITINLATLYFKTN